MEVVHPLRGEGAPQRQRLLGGGLDIGQPFGPAPRQQVGVPDVGHQMEQGLEVAMIFRDIPPGKRLEHRQRPPPHRGEPLCRLPPDAGDSLASV